MARKNAREAGNAARAARDARLEQIARDTLGLETLEARNSDRLDFREIAVWDLKAAMAAAYEAGAASARKGK